MVFNFDPPDEFTEFELTLAEFEQPIRIQLDTRIGVSEATILEALGSSDGARYIQEVSDNGGSDLLTVSKCAAQ